MARILATKLGREFDAGGRSQNPASERTRTRRNSSRVRAEFVLDSTIDRAIVELARDAGTSRSEVVRMAVLALYLRRSGASI